MFTLTRAAVASLLLGAASAAPYPQDIVYETVVVTVDGYGYGGSTVVETPAPAPPPAPIATTTTQNSSPAPTASGKRGLAYNDVSLLSAFDGSSEVTWSYNWASTSGGSTAPFTYLPMLWGTGSLDSWSSDAAAGIAAGSTALLGFNEPDNSGQSNMSPQEAASLWPTYMNPFSGQATLISPAVTNAPAPLGVGWLSDFFSACSGCQVDAIAMHWYASSSDAAYFQSYFTSAHEQFPDYPIYITEFGCTDGSNEDINSFLETVLPWLDAQDWIAGYAYFWAAEGFLIDSSYSNSLSDYGSTFYG